MKQYAILVIILFALTSITFGCASAPVYRTEPGLVIPTIAKIGLVEQIKCTAECTTPEDPKTFTNTLRAKLESLLGRSIVVLPPAPYLLDAKDFSKVVTASKEMGLDYAVNVQLVEYTDPPTSTRSGAVAITALTAVLPVRVVSYTTSRVTAHVRVIRMSDGKIVGHWEPDESGGTLSRCTTLTENIAEGIYENQFKNRSLTDRS